MPYPVAAVRNKNFGNPTYIDKVLSLAPLAFWPLNEPTGTVAYDRSGNGYNGAYTGVDLGQPGQGGQTCPYFDGTNDYVNVYSAGLVGAFSGAEGSLASWVRVYNAGVWDDATYRNVNVFQVDANNYVQLSKYNTAGGRIAWDYKAGGTTLSRVKSSMVSVTGWFHMALTWSKSGDAMKAYHNGVQEGATITGLGTWAGTVASNRALLGAAITTPGSPWYGWLQYVGLWNRALSAAEVLKLATI